MSKRIAIVGSGQLAQMMAQEGLRMGLSFSFLAEGGEDTCCVDNLGKVVQRTAEMSAEAIYQALGQPEVISVEKEHVDVDLLRALQAFCPVHPNPDALEKFKNRFAEKTCLRSLGIPLADFQAVHTAEDLARAFASLAKPVFLKSQEQGYDGYNQYKLTAENFAETAAKISFPGNWVAESGVPFQREISFIAVRSSAGEIRYYPPVENYHLNGTLLTSLAPAPDLSAAQIEQGKNYLTKLLEHSGYIGVMCVECFLCDGQLLVNEIAPRVHNSGHWTSKGAVTSQFENHIRAVADLPLGSTEARGISGMLNLLGVVLSPQQACSENAFLTLYGKALRPRRKLGHVTVVGHNHHEVRSQVQALRHLAYKEVL